MKLTLNKVFFGLLGLFVLLSATWYTLNRFRVHYYNDEINDKLTPYGTIIRTQDALIPFALFFAVCAFVAGLWVAVRWMLVRVKQKPAPSR
jgi:hypothetical protein